MRLWWEVARRGFRRYATYRWATVAGVFTNSVFAFIMVYVYMAMFAEVPQIGEWDLTDTLTYTFVSQGMLMPLYLWGWQDIAETVYSGQIATDLYRPFDYQTYWLAQDIGRATYHALLRGFPPFILGAVLFDLRLPTEPATWALFAVSFYLAVVVSFALRFMVNISAFWILNERGVHGIAAALWTVLSGFTIPIAFYPEAARTFIHSLPFVAMFELPISIFLEHATGVEAIGALGVQVMWVIVLLLAGRVMLGAGARKLVVQGG